MGACGTLHYFLLHALSATVRHELGVTGGVGRQAVFVGLNTAIFAIPAGVLYLNRRSLGGRYSVVVGAWTATFLLSDFFAFPTANCP